MKRIVMMAGCIVASCALSGLAAATASAEPPEFGHCVKVAPKTGEYQGGHCITQAPGKGSWNWVPGGGAKPKITVALEEPVIKSAGRTITCPFAEGEGTYASAKTLTLSKLVFQDCQQAGAKTVLESWCQNVGSFRGEIPAKEVTGELGYIEHVGNKTKVGLDLKATTGTSMAMFECGGASETIPMLEIGTGTGTLLELEGSVIGRVKKLNKPVEENLVSFAVDKKSGAQVPEQFEGGAKDTLIEDVGLTKTAEPATLSTLAEIVNEEAIEIKGR
jgi:hypothetical protein